MRKKLIAIFVLSSLAALIWVEFSKPRIPHGLTSPIEITAQKKLEKTNSSISICGEDRTGHVVYKEKAALRDVETDTDLIHVTLWHQAGEEQTLIANHLYVDTGAEASLLINGTIWDNNKPWSIVEKNDDDSAVKYVHAVELKLGDSLNLTETRRCLSEFYR